MTDTELLAFHAGDGRYGAWKGCPFLPIHDVDFIEVTWSPTRRQLLVLRRDGADLVAATVAPDGESAERWRAPVAVIEGQKLDPRRCRALPDDNRVACWGTESPDNTGRSDRLRLLVHGFDDPAPARSAVSPEVGRRVRRLAFYDDGSRVAFAMECDEGKELVVGPPAWCVYGARADATGRMQLGRLPGEVRMLVFSAAVARVALAGEPAPYAGRGMAISMAGTTPGSIRPVTRLSRTRASFGTQEGVFDVAWSPDGSTLAAYADVVDDGGCTSSWGSGCASSVSSSSTRPAAPCARSPRGRCRTRGRCRGHRETYAGPLSPAQAVRRVPARIGIRPHEDRSKRQLPLRVGRQVQTLLPGERRGAPPCGRR